jgi:photosystem II stability/assembly factor-like uncharacterized protein
MMRQILRAGGILLLGILCATVLAGGRAAFAQQMKSEMYAGMKWRMIGPFRGGRVLAAAGVPGNPSTYYFGANGGGVWKTTDGGTVWKPIFEGQAVAGIGALALAPSNPNIIYVGTGESSVSGYAAFGNGVYKSTDAGTTWQHAGLDDSRHIAKIIVDPRNPDIALVAALGHIYGANEERGVFRTADGGKTWKKVLYKDAKTGAVDLCFDPGDARVVYATLWHSVRVPWLHGTQYGPGSGIYKSTDGGVTWTQITGHGLPAGDWGRIGVAVAPGNRGWRVYAIIEAKKDGGLYRSDDAGATWQRTTEDKRISGVWFFGQVFTDPHNADVVYLPETSVYRSADGGHTFTPFKGAPGGDDYHVIWIDPENTQRMILGVDQGATISLDGGQTWSSWYNQPTAQFYNVATDHRYPYRVYGAQQDSGTVATSSRGDYGEITERDWFPAGPGESGYLIPDPLNPDIVYNGGPGGSVMRFFRTTGQTQDISPAPIALGSKYRLNWTIPLQFSPQDPRTLYLGAQFLMQTTNGGASWKAISPDLTETTAAATRVTDSPKDAKDAKDAETGDLGNILTIAASAVREGVIWVGTNNGLVQLTPDGGASWQNVTPPGIPAWSEIGKIETSHFDAGTAYVAADGNQLDDHRPHIFRTRDFGQSWQEVAGGIRETDFVRVVREDPARKGLLFAGSETGVYFSLDDGDHWQSLKLNMPTVAIHDLAIEQDDLVAATHGRSFWILDDVTPLRQMAEGFSGAEAHLFVPRTAMRIRRDENQNTPLPPEIPGGTNPPNGAILNYDLPSAATGDITLGIYGGDGKLIRELSSKPLPPREGPSPFIPEHWILHPQPLAKDAGMHRVVWDLRYPDPPAIHHQNPYTYPIGAMEEATPEPPQGPMVLPGRYEVRLTVGEQTYREPLEVKMDPRVEYARYELQSQLDLELKMSRALAANRAAHEQVTDLRGRLAELMKQRPATDAVAAAVKALDAKAAGIEGEALGLFDEPKTPTLGVVNDSLVTLIGLVDSADLAPTEQSFGAFHAACTALNAALGNWRELKTKDLAALNQSLAGENGAVLPAYADLPDDPDCRK